MLMLIRATRLLLELLTDLVEQLLETASRRWRLRHAAVRIVHLAFSTRAAALHPKHVRSLSLDSACGAASERCRFPPQCLATLPRR